MNLETGRSYRITHRTDYRYSDVVTSSYGRGFLTPRDSAVQRCLSYTVDIDPAPADPGRGHGRRARHHCHRGHRTIHFRPQCRPTHRSSRRLVAIVRIGQ